MKKTQNLQALEWLEKEKKKDEAAVKAAKTKTINEVKGWHKQEMFKIDEKPKISFADKLKKIFGR
jgi:hypothetical protein